MPATKTLATRKQHPQLSCIVDATGPRGQHLGRESFVVPPQSYGEGYVTGERLAFDLMRALRSPKGANFDVLQVLRAAGAAIMEREHYDDSPSTRGAGVGFLRTLERYLEVASVLVDHDQLQCQMEARRAKVEAMLSKERQARRDDFLRRMEIGKAAAARRRAQGGNSGAGVAHGH